MRRPGFWPGHFSIYFYFIELSETKMPVLADLFFGLQVIDFGLFMDFWGDGVWVLGA
jgi:hypothetical protein